MTFADKLKELRRNAGLTQDQLAERAGMPVWTLRNLEQGRRFPSWGNVVKVARAFGVNSAFFDDCDEVSPEALSVDDEPEQPARSSKRK